MMKYNPLSNVTSAEVWNFLRVMVNPPPHLLRFCAALERAKSVVLSFWAYRIKDPSITVLLP